MSWRDSPEIIWQDRQGDRLEHGKAFFSGHVLQVREGRDHRAVCMPESVADRVEATERWLAGLGLTADDIRELPRPIEVGDIVTVEGREGVHVVRAIDGDIALLRRGISGQPMVASIENLRHADEPEAEAPVERCTPDNRMCRHEKIRCCKKVDGFTEGGSTASWVCFRPVEHDGDCIPCGGVRHNLHLRPEDR